MRHVLGWVVLVLSGCATVDPTPSVTTVQSKRVFFGTSPMGPQALAGASGIGLAGQVMAGEAIETGPGSGVAFSRVQPNLGTVFQVDRWYVGGHFSFSSPTFGVVRGSTQAAGVAADQLAWETVVLFGRDLPVTERFGFNLSTELGIAAGTLRSDSTLANVISQLAYPMLRGGGGVWGSPHPSLRLFAGIAGNTTVWNTPTSTITRTCAGSCSTADSGVASFTGVGVLGGGLRWQAAKGVSLSAELWVPFTSNSAGIPPQVAVTLRLGDFAFTSSPPPRQEEPITPSSAAVRRAAGVAAAARRLARAAVAAPGVSPLPLGRGSG